MYKLWALILVLSQSIYLFAMIPLSPLSYLLSIQPITNPRAESLDIILCALERLDLPKVKELIEKGYYIYNKGPSTGYEIVAKHIRMYPGRETEPYEIINYILSHNALRLDYKPIDSSPTQILPLSISSFLYAAIRDRNWPLAEYLIKAHIQNDDLMYSIVHDMLFDILHHDQNKIIKAILLSSKVKENIAFIFDMAIRKGSSKCIKSIIKTKDPQLKSLFLDSDRLRIIIDQNKVEIIALLCSFGFELYIAEFCSEHDRELMASIIGKCNQAICSLSDTFFHSVIANNIENIKSKLTQELAPSVINSLVNTKDSFGYTPLLYAIHLKHFKIAEELLNLGPDYLNINIGASYSLVGKTYTITPLDHILLSLKNPNEVSFRLENLKLLKLLLSKFNAFISLEGAEIKNLIQLALNLDYPQLLDELLREKYCNQDILSEALYYICNPTHSEEAHLNALMHVFNMHKQLLFYACTNRYNEIKADSTQ